MAELSEVFDDVADNTKKLFKNKGFLIAVVGVAGVALYVALTRGKSEEAEEATAYGAVGYAGYPAVSGGGGGSEYAGSVDTDYLSAVEDVLNSNTSYYESIINTTVSEQNEQITALSNKLISTEETITKQNAAIERQNAISQMQANSNLYNSITDRATKDALHAENMAIAEKMGWTFDKTTGNYFENGSVVYTTAKQDAAARGVSTTTTTTKTAAPATTTYTNNATYAAAKQTAATSGTTATTPKTTTTTTKQTTSINAGLSGGKTGSGNMGGTVVATTASGMKIYSSKSTPAATANTKKNISSTSSKSGTATAGKLI